MKHLLLFNQLADMFVAKEEELAEDITSVCVTLIKNSCDGSMKITVAVYGGSGLDNTPIATEIIYDPQIYIGKYFDKPPICPHCLINLLFDPELINLLISKSIKVYWNKDLRSQVIIDPANLYFLNKLVAENQ